MINNLFICNSLSANVGIIFIPAIALTNVNYLIIVVTFKSSI